MTNQMVRVFAAAPQVISWLEQSPEGEGSRGQCVPAQFLYLHFFDAGAWHFNYRPRPRRASVRGVRNEMTEYD